MNRVRFSKISKKKYRSLLILGMPRSGSTALEHACHMMIAHLGFKNKREFLNRSYAYAKVKFPHHLGKRKFDFLQGYCKKFVHNKLVRDVVQTEFMAARTDWVQEHFNVLYIVRPLKEIRLCAKLKGWSIGSKKLRKRLDDIPESEAFKRLSYDDFIFRPKVLYGIMRRWYPEWKKFDYLTPVFIHKREQTLLKLARYGLR